MQRHAEKRGRFSSGGGDESWAVGSAECPWPARGLGKRRFVSGSRASKGRLSLREVNMNTWILYLLWLLTGGNDASASEDTTSSNVDSGQGDDLDYDDVDCDAFDFDDSEFDDFEDDEGFFH